MRFIILLLFISFYAHGHLTHRGRVTHICVGKLIIIASDNGLSPGRHQGIIWNNAGILSIGLLGTNFSEILIEILTFSFMKMRLKVSSAKWRPFCLGLNVLNGVSFYGHYIYSRVLSLAPHELSGYYHYNYFNMFCLHALFPEVRCIHHHIVLGTDHHICYVKNDKTKLPTQHTQNLKICYCALNDGRHNTFLAILAITPIDPFRNDFSLRGEQLEQLKVAHTLY